MSLREHNFKFNTKAAFLNGLAIAGIPLLMMAAILLLSGAVVSFHATEMKDLKSSAEEAIVGSTGFWTLRLVLHVACAAIFSRLFLKSGQFKRSPKIHLWVSILVGVALHYGLHIIQGINLAKLLSEQRAWDIPVFLILGSFAAWHWFEWRANGDRAATTT